MLSRRNFLKSAAGLLVASTALAVPERKVWALDQTMIPAKEGLRIRDVPDFIPHLGLHDAPLYNDFEAYAAFNPYRGDANLITLGDPSLFNKWDVVIVDGEWMMITSDPLDSAEVTVVRDLLGPTRYYDASGVESADWV
jgi:hypothetical protein